MLVHLCVFSGRPNPVWGLGFDFREKIDALLARLPVLDGVVWDTPVVLGYRGLRVNGVADGRWSEILVWRDRIVVESRDGRKRCFQDSGCLLEDMLLATAPGDRVDAKIVERIRSERETS